MRVACPGQPTPDIPRLCPLPQRCSSPPWAPSRAGRRCSGTCWRRSGCRLRAVSGSWRGAEPPPCLPSRDACALHCSLPSVPCAAVGGLLPPRLPPPHLPPLPHLPAPPPRSPRSLLWLPAGHPLRLPCHALLPLLPGLLRDAGKLVCVLGGGGGGGGRLAQACCCNVLSSPECARRLFPTCPNLHRSSSPLCITSPHTSRVALQARRCASELTPICGGSGGALQMLTSGLMVSGSMPRALHRPGIW